MKLHALIKRTEYEQLHATVTGQQILTSLESSHKKAIMQANDGHQYSVERFQSTAEKLGFETLVTYDDGVLAPTSDLIVTLGGDGTFLHGARRARGKILGVRTDNSSKGYLTSIPAVELQQALERIAQGKYETQPWYRAKATVHDQEVLTMNEFQIKRDDVLRNNRMSFTADGKNYDVKESYGLIVSTGTGSTGLYKNTMGTPFPRDCPTLGFRPIAGGGTPAGLAKGFNITPRGNDYLLIADARERYKLTGPVEIHLAEPLEVIHF